MLRPTHAPPQVPPRGLCGRGRGCAAAAARLRTPAWPRAPHGTARPPGSVAAALHGTCSCVLSFAAAHVTVLRQLRRARSAPGQRHSCYRGASARLPAAAGQCLGPRRENAPAAGLTARARARGCLGAGRGPNRGGARGAPGLARISAAAYKATSVQAAARGTVIKSNCVCAGQRAGHRPAEGIKLLGGSCGYRGAALRWGAAPTG